MGEEINISESAIIYRDRVKLPAKVAIGEYSIVGKKASYTEHATQTIIGESCTIGAHVVIYEAVNVKAITQIEDFCRIGENTKIGRNCRLVYGTKIYGDVEIGDNCVIGGFICEDVIIGDNCRIFGELIHKHDFLTESFSDMRKWDEGGEPAPIIRDNVFVGFGAKIIGQVIIGRGSFIYPNAIVTEDVPENMNVKGINQKTPRIVD
jgi:serine acetyltransferase